MQVGDWVQVYSGDYKGYYGHIKEIGAAPDHENQVRVSHREDFAGFWIDIADLEQPPALEAENG